MTATEPEAPANQLLLRTAYDELLARHGFAGLGSAQLTPVHALTRGRRT